MGKFEDKVVLVTGAAGGVGRASTLSFAAEGAKVYATDIDEEGLAKVAAEAHSAGTPITTAVHDLLTKDGCVATVRGAVDALGGLDVLVNVAGICSSHHAVDITEETWNLTLAVNLNAPFFLTQAAIPHLLETSGNVVNVASNAGIIGQAYTVPYCASKGAVILMTKSFAMEYVKTPLRFNAVAPGGMQTNLVENYEMPSDVDFDLVGRYMGFRGLADPQTCANGILFLAADEDGGRCNGTILSIDGGVTAG